MQYHHSLCQDVKVTGPWLQRLYEAGAPMHHVRDLPEGLEPSITNIDVAAKIATN